MYTQAVLIAILATLGEARFNQEQIPIAAIGAVTSGGGPGVAATLAGGAISDLLGAADPCDKLSTADNIIAQLGTGADAIAAARGLVHAEKNFNPVNGQGRPVFCTDPALPATEELRGILPLNDPSLDGAAAINQIAIASLANPIANNAGKSIQDLLVENGFTDFQGGAGAGAGTGAGAGAGAGAGNNNAGNGNAGNGNAGNGNASAAPVSSAAPAASGCGTTLVTVTREAAATQAPAAGGNAGNGNGNNNNNAGNGNAGNGNNNNNNNNNAGNGNAGNGNAGNGAGAGAGAGGAADFGTCDPTISLEGGRANRAANELTFQSNDPAIAANQQEALNPNIITNRICDELTNICGANQAAKDICLDAKAQVLANGARDASIVTLWNGLVSV